MLFRSKYLKYWIQQKPEDETNKIEVLFWEKEITRCQKILDLYTWWTIDRLARKDPYNEVDRQHEEDTQKLIELTKLRGSLWT